MHELKADPVLRDLPVIVMSALDDQESIVRCIEMGAADYLAKPCNPVLLKARVGACLEQKRLRDQEVAYLRLVRQVTTAAAAVETGTFDLDVLRDAAARDDDLGHLARVFLHMADEARAREQRLKQQVTELRIAINEAKQAQQVTELTETDFFRDLQANASRLRNLRD